MKQSNFLREVVFFLSNEAVFAPLDCIPAVQKINLYAYEMMLMMTPSVSVGNGCTQLRSHLNVE